MIAATALISAVNAVTLKPTQCALWLRPPDAAAKKATSSSARFNAVYDRLERGTCALIAAWCERSGLMVIGGAGRLLGAAVWGLTRACRPASSPPRTRATS